MDLMPSRDRGSAKTWHSWRAYFVERKMARDVAASRFTRDAAKFAPLVGSQIDDWTYRVEWDESLETHVAKVEGDFTFWWAAKSRMDALTELHQHLQDMTCHLSNLLMENEALAPRTRVMAEDELEKAEAALETELFQRAYDRVVGFRGEGPARDENGEVIQ